MILISGILVADIIVHDLQKIADPGEVIYCKSDLHIGGHVANVSINLTKLGLPKNEITVVGPIGKDFFGEFIESTLKFYLENIHLQKLDSETSKDVILILENEDRRYHAEPGANLFLDANYVRKFIKNEPPFIFYLGGAGLLGKLDEKLKEIYEIAKENGCLTFLDIVTPYKKDWEFIIPALKYIDIFHCNDYELTNITNLEDVEDSIKKISEMGVTLPIITLGAKGLLARLKNRIIFQPPFDVPVIDPTGAGDAFCAGFIYGLSQENIKRIVAKSVENLTFEQLSHILMISQATSAACISGVGTTSGVNRKQIDDLVEKQGKKIIIKTKEKKNLRLI